MLEGIIIPDILLRSGTFVEKENGVIFRCLCGVERKIAENKKFSNAIRHVKDCSFLVSVEKDFIDPETRYTAYSMLELKKAECVLWNQSFTHYAERPSMFSSRAFSTTMHITLGLVLGYVFTFYSS